MDDEIIDIKVARNSVKIESLEDNVSQLWKKWDSMQKLVTTTLVTSVICLFGIIGVFIAIVSK